MNKEDIVVGKFAHKTEFWLRLKYYSLICDEQEWLYHAKAESQTEAYSYLSFPPILCNR